MSDNQIYLIHAVEAIYRIEFYAKCAKQQFLDSILLQDAIYKNFEVVGEALNRVSDSFKQQFPQISWRKAVDMRNYIIHNYDGVDPNKVWKTIQENIPTLKLNLIELIENWTEIEKKIIENLK